MGKARGFKKRRALRTVPQFGGGMEQIVGADWRSFSATADVAFLLGFSSLFSIINPIGGALIFDSIAKDFAPADRMMMAARVGFYSLLVMFGALWGGTYVLHFFGVSIDALRIAGGTVVASSGWQLLISGDHHADQKGHEPVALWGGDGDPQQLAFFPLTLPFTTGPGTIAVAITIGAERPSNDGTRRLFCRHEPRGSRERRHYLDRLSILRPLDPIHGGDGATSHRPADRLPAHVHRRSDPRRSARRPHRPMARCLVDMT